MTTSNGILFLNGFLSYVVVFAVFVAVILLGVFIGSNIRKAKDAKAAAAPETIEKVDDDKVANEA